MRELELEQEMITKGQQLAFKRAVTDDISKGSSLVLAYNVSKLTDLVKLFMTSVREGGVTKKYLRLLTPLEDSTIAFITLRVAVTSLGKYQKEDLVAKTIGDQLCTEIRAQEWINEVDKYKKQHTLERIAEYNQYHRKVETLNKSIMRHKDLGVEFESFNWPLATKIQIGLDLVNLLYSLSIFTSVGDRGKSGNKVFYFTGTREVLDYIKQANNTIFRPTYKPMIAVPRDWDSVVGGGYHYLPSLPIIKWSNIEQLNTLRECDLSVVYTTLNKAQRTSWRINKPVLDTIDHFYNLGVSIPSVFPDVNDTPPPPCPKCSQEVVYPHECFDNDPALLRDWCKLKFINDTNNASLVGKRIGFSIARNLAHEYSKYECFYYPYQLDFRGRLYPVSSYLTPQGTDLSKGLLEFAEGKPCVTKSSKEWFKIHIANCWGGSEKLDKQSYETRIKWVDDNESFILAVGEDPISNKGWIDAEESPVCFLAACIEYYKLHQDPNHLCHLAIAQDGTCSGLQHYSAALRDEEGGRAVNLVPGGAPNDIYRVVAEKTLKQLESIEPGVQYTKDGTDWFELAQQWLTVKHLINRKCTKRSVMTLPYGSTFKACMDYVKEYIYQHRTVLPWENQQELSKACNWLSGRIWEEIGNTVIAARTGMDWLKKISKLFTDAGLPVSWKAPSGIRVLQAYVSTAEREIKTIIHGKCLVRGERYAKDLGDGTKRLKLTVYEPTDTLDSRRQRSGIAPNFIHSMDASALMAAVNRMTTTHSFALIHDSYGTHACDSQELADELRRAFIELYTDHDIFEELRQECLSLGFKDVPECPPRGTLDLTLVQDSKYFFA